MLKLFIIAATAGLVLASHTEQAYSMSTRLVSGMGGVEEASGASHSVKLTKADRNFYEYCKKVIDAMQNGMPPSRDDEYVASDCIGIFIDASIASSLAAGQPAQPGRDGYSDGARGLPGGSGGAAGEPGQDGEGLPGLPGGRGGAAGGSRAPSTADVEEELLDYCDAVLREARRGNSATKPVESNDYSLSDCVDYFASFAASGSGKPGGDARPGRDGPSIGTGKGGKGGEAGSGPGGASGGAGGAGVEGGRGGKGGAGGSGN